MDAYIYFSEYFKRFYAKHEMAFNVAMLFLADTIIIFIPVSSFSTDTAISLMRYKTIFTFSQNASHIRNYRLYYTIPYFILLLRYINAVVLLRGKILRCICDRISYSL